MGYAADGELEAVGTDGALQVNGYRVLIKVWSGVLADGHSALPIQHSTLKRQTLPIEDVASINNVTPSIGRINDNNERFSNRLCSSFQLCLHTILRIRLGTAMHVVVELMRCEQG
jgi:hypothetical protein